MGSMDLGEPILAATVLDRGSPAPPDTKRAGVKRSGGEGSTRRQTLTLTPVRAALQYARRGRRGTAATVRTCLFLSDQDLPSFAWPNPKHEPMYCFAPRGLRTEFTRLSASSPATHRRHSHTIPACVGATIAMPAQHIPSKLRFGSRL